MGNKVLFVIPARGGSKGIPYKNIKEFAGKPLIYFSIDLARKFVSDQDICVSSDDSTIIDVVEKYGLKVPFIRPAELATDTASTNDVLLHAVKHYESLNIFYDKIILLQPTSPLREEFHLIDALNLYSSRVDMVVSVKETDAGSVLCEEDQKGFLQSLFNQGHQRRQDAHELYEYNGALYIINIQSLKEKGLGRFNKKIKYVMSQESSIDIDNPFDWQLAEVIYKNRFV